MPSAARQLGRGSARRAAPGFTLIEASLATVILGVGVLAMVDAQTAFVSANSWSSHAATATYLANEVRERTRSMPKHDRVHGLWLEDDGGSGVLHGWGPDAGEVTLSDLDDLDDWDGIIISFVGTDGIADGDARGPINAFCEVIPELSIDGTEQDGTMYGWTQRVTVVKVHPFDTGLVVSDRYTEAASGDFPGRDVDEYPLRVTVEVLYQGVNDAEAQVVTEVTWIVP